VGWCGWWCSGGASLCRAGCQLQWVTGLRVCLLWPGHLLTSPFVGRLLRRGSDGRSKTKECPKNKSNQLKSLKPRNCNHKIATKCQLFQRSDDDMMSREKCKKKVLGLTAGRMGAATTLPSRQQREVGQIRPGLHGALVAGHWSKFWFRVVGIRQNS
jgi:hypothetical protein